MYKIVKKYLITGALITSIALNLIFAYIILLPDLEKKFNKPEYFSVKDDPGEMEKIIVEKSYEMFISKTLQMKWQEESGIKSKLKALRSKKEFQVYNYPRAYLALGLIEYSLKNDSALLDKVKYQFDKYYVDVNGAKFEFNMVDLTPIGLAALKLYQHNYEDKYKKLADQIYMYLASRVININNYSIIQYNAKDPAGLILVDVLGMVCPFLAEYSIVFNDSEAYKLAESELLFYIKYGLNRDTFLPYHAIDLNHHYTFGPSNWGRGIGWYILAMESIYCYQNKVSNPEPLIIESAQHLLETLNLLKFNNVYTQFPGTSKQFDSSSTTMLMYGSKKMGQNLLTKTEILKLLSQNIRTSGEIDFCSGDTYWVNLYSRKFGVSELSQGMLLMLISL